MKHYITQCPACNTRFQITPEQLHAADGQVRCGVCAEIFAADQYLEIPSPADSARQRKAKRLGAIHREPLKLYQRPPGRSPLATLAWSLLSLTALAGLALQVLWFERDRLSLYPDLQPWYQQVCARIDCRLQPRQDLPSIRSRNLVLREDADYSNVINIDLIIENDAPFAQPFPALQLQFSALDGTPRALRTFQPGEYLAGDINPEGLMPSGKPIQVSFSILEPGPRTPNYQLQFVAATTVSD